MAIGLGAEVLSADLDDAPLLPQTTCATLSRLSIDVIHAVMKAAALALVKDGGADDEELSVTTALNALATTQSGVTVADLREAYAAASCILVRCAHDTCSKDGVQHRQQLLTYGIQDEELIARLLPLLAEHVSNVQAVLRVSSYDFAHVVDASWRLDYVLRSSPAGNIHEPVYFVELKVQPPQGRVRNVQFSCSVEGMRDLVYRLQDATNTIEKIASASEKKLNPGTG